MAPQVGLEPTTLRLTAGCSAIELLRSVLGRARRARPLSSLSIISLAGGVGISKLRATARNFAAACILLRPVFCFGLCFASACVCGGSSFRRGGFRVLKSLYLLCRCGCGSS